MTPVLFVLLLLLAVAMPRIGDALAGDEPLRFGGSTMGGETPLLLGFAPQDQSSDTARTIYYAYRPFGEIRVQIGLANDGDVPLTVEGLALDDLSVAGWRPWFHDVELRLPPAPTLESLPLSQPASGPWYSEPFRPFELPPHTATTLALVARFPDCPSTPMITPTRAPGATPDPSLQPLDALTTIGELPVRYSVLGRVRVAQVRLLEQISPVQMRGPDGSGGCDNPDYRATETDLPTPPPAGS